MKLLALLHRPCGLFSAFMIAASAMHGSFALADETVHSIDGVRGALTSSDTRRMFDRSMSGKEEANGFGTTLPPGFTTALLIEQLAPGQDMRSVVLAGAKPWPLRPHSYVAVVCVADSPEQAVSARQYSKTSCDGVEPDGSDAQQVWFGVFENTDGGTPRLVARTESPVATPTDWGNTNIDMPDYLAERDARSAPEAKPASWTRFDLAAYQLRENEYAFGVRAGWSVGYAGGGADFEALYLFAIDGKTLRVVFAQPMAYDKMIAGDWHKDGTRSHDVYDAADALAILPSMTDGYHDLQVRGKSGGDWRRTFKWSEADKRYR